MPYGYNGKILRVNLTTEKITVEEKDWVFYRKYIGGRGLISYFLLNEVSANVDALCEKNKLIFAFSVMTGVPIPGFSRHSVGAKSPLTKNDLIITIGNISFKSHLMFKQRERREINDKKRGGEERGKLWKKEN